VNGAGAENTACRVLTLGAMGGARDHGNETTRGLIPSVQSERFHLRVKRGMVSPAPAEAAVPQRCPRLQLNHRAIAKRVCGSCGCESRNSPPPTRKAAKELRKPGG